MKELYYIDTENRHGQVLVFETKSAARDWMRRATRFDDEEIERRIYRTPRTWRAFSRRRSRRGRLGISDSGILCNIGVIYAPERGDMRFEYNQRKSDSNAEKHGIDFEEAQELWDDPYLIEYAVESHGERRFVVVARLLDGHWAAICTMRGETVRIISVRRATKEEVSEYDKAGNDIRRI